MKSRSTRENAPVQRGDFRATSKSLEKDHNLIGDESATFSQLEAQFAKAGHRLRQKTKRDGTIYYLASRWGMFRELRGLEAAAAFLAVIGGM